MDENQHADQEAIFEGVVAGAMAWAVANLAEKYLTRRYSPRAAQMYFSCVLLSIFGAFVLFFGAIIWAYGLLMHPVVSGIWLGTCGFLLLWPLPATYVLACCEARARRRTGRQRGPQSRRIIRELARVLYRYCR